MKNSSVSSRGLFLSCIIADAIWIAVSLCLLLMSCAIAYSNEDPQSLLAPLTLCSLYVSAIICGIISVKLSGDGIMSGIISGTIIALFLFLLSAFPMPDSGIPLPLSISLLIAVIPATVVGAYLGKKRSKKPKSMIKKRLK